MKCSNCGAMLNPNAKFCVKCGTRILTQKAGAESQNAEPDKKNGVSDPGPVSFDAPGQNQGMGQYARSRASYMDAAYSNVGENPEETAGNRYTPQEPANYKSQNGNEYTSAYGEAPQESLKYRNQSGNAYRSVYGGTPQESLKYGNQGGNEYTSAYGGTPQESLKYGNQGGNEYTSAYGEAPQESLKY
ncbi:MAG: zinc ribbon domain-containing protein, partial [Lachnospiraceae bacterium]|nr:zinc ribbon domain-containing protein [Lachnospiraceae bacterium]